MVNINFQVWEENAYLGHPSVHFVSFTIISFRKIYMVIKEVKYMNLHFEHKLDQTAWHLFQSSVKVSSLWHKCFSSYLNSFWYYFQHQKIVHNFKSTFKYRCFLQNSKNVTDLSYEMLKNALFDVWDLAVLDFLSSVCVRRYFFDEWHAWNELMR